LFNDDQGAEIAQILKTVLPLAKLNKQGMNIRFMRVPGEMKLSTGPALKKSSREKFKFILPD
jgi:hypothetical protein